MTAPDHRPKTAPATVRHPLPTVEWPTATAAKKALWFKPVQYGPVRALRRTWVPAMVPWRAADDGAVNDSVLDWYGRFAQGKPGVLVVEATGIRDIPSGPLLRIGDDRFVPGLQQLVDRVKQESDGETRLFIQLIDFLTIKRRPEKAKFFTRFLAVDDSLREAVASSAGRELANDDEVRSYLTDLDDAALQTLLSPKTWRDYAYGYREEVSDLHLPHVANLPQVLPPLFASAAGRAKTAGFDGVELHFAHAYTMASFLSRRNRRDDGYGGSLDHRIRLPLEVFAAVREGVGADFCVGTRFLGDESIDDGSTIEDAVAYGRRFAAAGFDFLSVSKGGKFEDAKRPRVGEAAYPYTGPSGHECMPTVKSDARGPFGRNVPLAAAIRQAVRGDGHETPVIAAGGICGFDQAEDILKRGDADAVAAARQTLADPDWFAKTEAGHGHLVRRCIFTNYCEGLDQKHKEVTCQLWDREWDGDETTAPRSKDGKRRLVAPPSAPEPLPPEE